MNLIQINQLEFYFTTFCTHKLAINIVPKINTSKTKRVNNHFRFPKFELGIPNSDAATHTGSVRKQTNSHAGEPPPRQLIAAN